MKATNDGGFAFPGRSGFVITDPTGIEEPRKVYGVSHTGMTLLDYFAGQALLGLVNKNTSDHAATSAYRYAEAMIAERQKRMEAKS